MNKKRWQERSIKWLKQKWLNTLATWVRICNFLAPQESFLRKEKFVFTVRFALLVITVDKRVSSKKAKSSFLSQSFLFLLFSIIITKNFTLIQTNGIVVIIDRNIYLRLFFCFDICIFILFSRSSIVKLWRNVNIFE